MSSSFCQKLELFPWRPDEEPRSFSLPSLAEWVVENSPNPHLTGLDRTTLQPLTQAGPLQCSLSQMLATFQNSLEQRVTALAPVTGDSCRGEGTGGSLGWRRGKGQPPPTPQLATPFSLLLIRAAGRMSDLGRNNCAVRPWRNLENS